MLTNSFALHSLLLHLAEVMVVGHDIGDNTLLIRLFYEHVFSVQKLGQPQLFFSHLLKNQRRNLYCPGNLTFRNSNQSKVT